MKTITLGAVLVTALVVIGGLYLLLRTPAPVETEPETTTQYPTGYQTSVPAQGSTNEPVVGQVDVISPELIGIPSQRGGLVRVKDFLKNPNVVEDDVNKGTYYLAGSDLATAEYTISYIASDSSFTVSIYNEPIGEVRYKAELDLLAQLGITEPEACNLRYVVLVQASVNPLYAGKNLGFSFCPGATAL